MVVGGWKNIEKYLICLTHSGNTWYPNIGFKDLGNVHDKNRFL
jgi:hypothetical protein